MIHIIQTEKFASVVSEKIKKKVKRELNAEIKFKRIEVKLFPPASILRNVEVVSLANDKRIEIHAEEVGLFFSLFDFFSRKFQIDTLRLNAVDLFVSTKVDEKEVTYKELFREYKLFKKKSPVIFKNIELHNFDIEVNKRNAFFRELKLSLFKGLVLTSGKLKEVDSRFFSKDSLNLNFDSLDFLFHMRPSIVEIKELTLKSGLDYLDIEGNIKPDGKIETVLDLKANLRSGIRSLANKTGYKKIIAKYPIDGLTKISLLINGKLESPEYKMNGKLELVESEYAVTDLVEFSLEKKKSKIWLNKLESYKDISSVKMSNPIIIYDLEQDQIESKEAVFEIKDLHTNDALYSLNSFLDVLKGKLNGVVKVGWNKKGIYFIPKKGFSLKNLKVYTPTYENLILENDGLEIISANLLLTYDLIFKFNSKLKFGTSELRGNGVFNKNGMNVSIFKSKVDLEEIGPIVGLKLKGAGELTGKIAGNYDNVKFFFNPNLKSLSLLDFNLGDIDGRILYDLKSSELKLSNVNGRYKGTRYEGDAIFAFDKDFFKIDIDVVKGTYSDAEEMVPELIKILSPTPLKLDLNFSSNIKYSSTFDIKKLKIMSTFKGENVNLYGERLDNFSGSLKLVNNELTVQNFVARKSQGNIQLNGTWNIKKDDFQYKGNLVGISLKDFDVYNTMNLGLNGKIRGEFYGNGNFSDFTSRAQFRLENSEIGNRDIKDSIFTIYNKGTDVFLSANIFEGISISEGYISLDKKRRKKSYFNSRLYTNNPSVLAGILSEHNYIDKTLRGLIDLTAETSFYVDDLEHFDFDFKAKELDLDYLGENIFVEQSKNNLYVKNGKMKNWNLSIKSSSNGYFQSTGKGDVSKSFQIDSRFRFNPVYLKLLSSKLLSAVGVIEGTSILLREKDSFSFHSESIGKDIDLKISKIPGALRNVNFKLLSEGQDLLLQKLEGSYGKGTIKADGNVRLKLPFPEVNINTSVNGAQVAITDKTYVVVSGNSTLKGSSLPYVLRGGVSVLHGEVLNEFDEFSKMMGLSQGYLRYIPNSGRLSKKDILTYEMDFDIFNPVQVKNSITDLRVDGSIKVRGGMLKPLFSGDINILPNVSRVFFKGNEFILSEGALSFLDVNKREVPEIKLAGVASVDRYEVGLSVEGKVDKFGIKLSSTPSLDQNQILSLLVLGVPDDINQELDDSEREQIAMQGGVGLIVERFKLVKPIDSMLGLKFSVSPEFQEDDSSLLDGRLSSGEAGTSRYKSGTKIKVQKQILKKVDVSFSSTVGGTVEETKEMNVNYNINKNLSLEGVYELRSVEEETEENPESVGADIKWKFSF